jgi:hypothetical protein
MRSTRPANQSLMQGSLFVASVLTTLALGGCEDKKEGLTVGATGKDGCELSVDGLSGSEWVIERINPDKSTTPDHSARIKFITEDGQLKAKYNVQSVADMYTYRCEKTKEDKITCREKPRVKDFCQALEAGGAKCDTATLKGLLPDASDKELEEGIKTGMEVVNKYKDKPEWPQFVAQNNNLGNKLRGVLYIKADSKRCQLRVTDNYMTIYNGKKVEDSNPVGTNPFVKNEVGELLWEHCENRNDFLPLSAGTFPEDPANVRPEPQQTMGKPVHFWYLASDALAPTEGCTHKYDLWLDGKSLAKGQAPKEVDDGKGGKRLEWHYEHTFSEPSPNALGNVVTAVVNTSCQGKEPVKKVACAALLVK